ncbi:c-type cytochrome [Massilia eburnea]|nr:cytochrome c [Massilia eburnea]
MRTGAWLFACAVLSAQAAVAADAKLVRGKYLVEGVLACANCHAVRDKTGAVIAEKGMAGGFEFAEEMFKSYASNITPDRETGIGKWTDAQLAKAIREGIRPDGSLIGPPMPIQFYRSLSDADLAATIRYLRAQPAVVNQVPKSTFNFPLPPNYGPPLKNVASPSPKDKVAYGGYLVAIAHCMECHTPRDERGMLVMTSLGAGGQNIKGPWGDSISRNLTPHAEGLRDWSDEQIAAAIRTGKDRSGKPYKPPMAFDWYHNINDADMAAIVAYLRTLPPQQGSGSK